MTDKVWNVPKIKSFSETVSLKKKLRWSYCTDEILVRNSLRLICLHCHHHKLSIRIAIKLSSQWNYILHISPPSFSWTSFHPKTWNFLLDTVNMIYTKTNSRCILFPFLDSFCINLNMLLRLCWWSVLLFWTTYLGYTYYMYLKRSFLKCPRKISF